MWEFACFRGLKLRIVSMILLAMDCRVRIRTARQLSVAFTRIASLSPGQHVCLSSRVQGLHTPSYPEGQSRADRADRTLLLPNVGSQGQHGFWGRGTERFRFAPGARMRQYRGSKYISRISWATYSRIRYCSGRLNVDDLLNELDAADLDRVRCGIPPLQDIVLDGGHLLP